MYDPNDFSQPHLPRLVENVGGRGRFSLPQIGLVRKIGPKGTRLFVEVERYGGYEGVRIAHSVLSRTSGCLRFPIKPKKTDDGKSEKEIAHAVVMSIEGRPENTVVLGYVDFEGDNDLLQRIAAYMKENPTHEFPWIDKHPSGPEIMQDGHGSWLLKTLSGHTIKLIERDGQESIEIITANETPLTLRARGTGTILVHSDEGNVETIAGETARTLAKNNEVTAEEDVGIIAGKTASIVGQDVEVLAQKDVSMAAAGDVNIGAGGSASVLSSELKLGIEAEVKKLVTEEFKAIFDAHIHGGVQTGSGSSGPSSTPMPQSALTTNTEAS